MGIWIESGITKKQKAGKTYRFLTHDGEPDSTTGIIIRENADGTRSVKLSEDEGEGFFTRCGHVPLPPYIKREDSWSDETRYQTVYAKSALSPIPGATA